MLCGWMLIGALGISQEPPALIDYDVLVEGLTDLRWMCEEPRKGERSIALEDLSASGTAELDHHGGPGVVGRVWCSRRDGVLRAWIDGGSEPAISWRLADFAEVARPDTLPPDPLAGALGRGWYSVVPIPFARSVRFSFEADSGGEARLQADLRLLGEGVTVAGLDADALRRHDPALRRIARIIADDQPPETLLTGMAGGVVLLKKPEMIDPAHPQYDGTYFYPIEGNGILRWWTMKILLLEDREAIEAVLRDVIVRFETGTIKDEEKGRPLLELPLGEFFGAGGGRDPYQNYLMGLREDGTFVFRLPMPYENHLKLILRYPSRPGVRFVANFGVDQTVKEVVPPLRLRGGWLLEDPALDGAFRCELPGPARVVSTMWSSECTTDAEWQDAPAFSFASGLTRARPGAWSQVTRRDGPGRFGRFTMIRQYAHDAPVAAAGETLSIAQPSRYSGAAGEARASMSLFWYGPKRLEAVPAAEDAQLGFGGSYSPEQRARWPRTVPEFFAVPEAFEGENLSITTISASSWVEVEDWSGLESSVSRKEVLVFHPSAAGEQFGFEVNAPIAGEYELVARLGAGSGSGPIAAFIDGKRVVELAAEADGPRTVREVVLHRGTFLPRQYQLALRALTAAPIALDCVVLRAVKP